MQIEYLDRLTPDIRREVEEIELASDVSIIVQVDPRRVQNLADQPDTMACTVTCTAATLFIPTPDYFPDGAVLHELLHCRRYLVEGVPQLVDCVDYATNDWMIGTLLAQHDNNIEHLVIVPEELERCPERQAHWERIMQREWNALNVGMDDAECRHQALVCWTFIQLVLPNSPTLSLAQAILNRLHLREVGVHFCDALIPVLADKEAAVKVWFEYLDIPLEKASLDYLNPQDKSHIEIPLLDNSLWQIK